MSIETVNYLQIGKTSVRDNPFYNTLNLFLKYYFVNNKEKDYYLNSFIKDIINNENEFSNQRRFAEKRPNVEEPSLSIRSIIKYFPLRKMLSQNVLRYR